MLALLATALLAASGQAPASSVKLSAPTQVSTIDTGRLKGEPTRLAWSPDGSKLYLETSERDKTMMVTHPRSYVMAADSGRPEPVTVAPDWVSEYWTWKSAKSAPGHDNFLIDVKRDERQETMTASPMGGSLARGDATGGGTSIEDVTTRAQQLHNQQVISLSLEGETVGEFVNTQFLPGYTFGWSPQSLGLIAYGNAQGKLAIMDMKGQKQQVDDSKAVLLPAWSPDGSKIAFLQKAGKNKYDLCVVTVSQ